MIGRGVSYGALSVINAIATGKGAGFGVDLKTEAVVEFTREPEFTVTIDGHSTENTLLAELCAQEMLNRCPDSGMRGAVIRTCSDIPISQGLKSSSSAANAILAAAADALGAAAAPLQISRLGTTVPPDEGLPTSATCAPARTVIPVCIVLICNMQRPPNRLCPLV